jgi:peptidoglycan/LPS O-acetylase OafA/YrhL
LWADYSYLSGTDAIALGCLTALVLKGRILSRRALWVSGLAGAGLMALVLGDLVPVSVYQSGLDMTVLALGTCLVIVPAAQSGWRGPDLLLVPGRRSYEVYLTHMFIVFGLLHLFVRAGRPLWAVPLYFVGAAVIATALGVAIARSFTDPMNQALRGSGRTS